MRWISGERFFTVLHDAAPNGVRDADPAFWQLRLDALRMANRPDQFDEAAIDYCMTYEVSPPSWEPSQCEVRISGSGNHTTQQPLSVVSEVSKGIRLRGFDAGCRRGVPRRGRQRRAVGTADRGHHADP
jgi:hypothetical protein